MKRRGLGALVRKKLMQILDLQGEIDSLLRDVHASPFGAKKWQYACPEALQRLVAMVAIQFVLYEPAGSVKGNDEFRVDAEKMLNTIGDQLMTLKTKKSDW